VEICTKIRRKISSGKGEMLFSGDDFFRKLQVKNMEPGQIYHVFNHANGWENLFIEPKNYHFFMEKMDKFLSPTIDIFAHCLMPNHFHMAAGIPEMRELEKRDERFIGLSAEEAGKRISKQFSNLFSSYTQSSNKLYQRIGSLFVPNMKIKQVTGEASLCKVIHYIHANPVHHGFTSNIAEWPYSSYNSLVVKTNKSKERDFVMKAFGGFKLFMDYHKQPITVRVKNHQEDKEWMRFGLNELDIE
jgi:putative transposase